MAEITLTFDNTLNASVQVGDTVYHCPTTLSGGFNTATQGAIIEIGTITSINYSTNIIVCNILETSAAPGADDFYLFSKDNKVNMTSPLGYFAKAKFENNSTSKSEMFTAACDIFESSK
jgi:hypothetical protein